MWTYSLSTSTSTSPTVSSRDQVRLLVGQTSSGDPALLYDAEIYWTLTQQPNPYFAAAQASISLAGKYTALASDRSVGKTRVVYLDRAKTLRDQAASLRRQGMLSGVQWYAGNMLQADQTADREDSTLVQPAFRIGQFDNPPEFSSTS